MKAFFARITVGASALAAGCMVGDPHGDQTAPHDTGAVREACAVDLEATVVDGEGDQWGAGVLPLSDQAALLSLTDEGLSRPWDTTVARVEHGGWSVVRRWTGPSNFQWISEVGLVEDGGILAIGSAFGALSLPPGSASTELSGPVGGAAFGVVVRLDAQGQTIWATALSFDEPWDMQITAATTTSEGLSIVGATTTHYATREPQEQTAWVGFVSQSGDLLWARPVARGVRAVVNDLVWAEGRIAAVGEVSAGADGYALGADTARVRHGNGTLIGWALQVDADGEVLWDHAVLSERGGRLASIAALDDGTFMVDGASWGGFQPLPDTWVPARTGRDAWMIQLDHTGQPVWYLQPRLAVRDDAQAEAGGLASMPGGDLLWLTVVLPSTDDRVLLEEGIRSHLVISRVEIGDGLSCSSELSGGLPSAYYADSAWLEIADVRVGAAGVLWVAGSASHDMTFGVGGDHIGHAFDHMGAWAMRLQTGW